MGEDKKQELAEQERRPRGRPRRGLDEAESRQRLIRTGLAFLTERGYTPSGVNDIIAAAEVPKGCFYHYFQSKEDFGEQLIDAYHEYFVKKLDRSFLDESVYPLHRIQSFVDEAIWGMAKHGYRRGCLVGNLSQEMGALPATFREKLIASLRNWEERLAACMRLAQETGQLSRAADVEELARCFWIGWEGAVLRAKLERSAEPMEIFARAFIRMLKNKE